MNVLKGTQIALSKQRGHIELNILAVLKKKGALR